MEGPSFLEEPLLGTIDGQLAEATTALEGVSNEDLDSITRQKLILDAVYAFDVADHVTTQYYLHGDVAVKGKAANRSVNATLELPNRVDTDLPTADQIYAYFTDDRREYVTDALETETFDWLRAYYERRDEFPFRDVYLAGLPIYRTLHDIRTATIERNNDLLPTEPARTVTENCRTLKRALVRYPIFRDVPPYVTEFETAVTPALQWLDSDGRTAINDEPDAYYHFVDRLYQLFYEGVWKAVGQHMSYHTVSGPAEVSTRDRREREMRQQRTEFRMIFNRFEIESDTPGVECEANLDRLPQLEPIDHPPEPEIPEADLEAISRDDPAFSLLQ